jgi:hypothetical protein
MDQEGLVMARVRQHDGDRRSICTHERLKDRMAGESDPRVPCQVGFSRRIDLRYNVEKHLVGQLTFPVGIMDMLLALFQRIYA